MELTITNVVLVALFVEALVQAVKPLWNADAKTISLPEAIAMAAGVLVAVLGKVNMLEGVFTTVSPVVLYVLYGLSGIALGRGTSFVHDLWGKLKTFNPDTAGAAAETANNIATIIQNITGTIGKKDSIDSK